MKRTLLLSTLLFAFSATAFSQGGGVSPLPNYEPPSPEASALGKYVDHPVSNFTGTPQIEIPLFTIESGRIQVPINLSYHGSGVLVDEIASRTGIGWVLNAGGVVTRTVKDLPDDLVPSPDNHNDYFGYFLSGGNITSVPMEVTQHHDLEPDVHYYNFGNKTGKIYFTSPTQPHVVNKDPIKVDGPYNGSNRFVITTEEGLIYTFEAIEYNFIARFDSGIGYDYTSSWYLTKIEDPVSSKTVTFQYRTDMPVNYLLDFSSSISQSLNCATLGAGQSPNYAIDELDYPKVLQKIVYDDGYIEFKADHNRQDLPGDKAYTEVNQYTYVRNTPTLVKGFNLSYTEIVNGDATPNNLRLYLESVQQKGADGTFLPPTSFFYKNRDQVPERYSAQQDIWGYYNANGDLTDPNTGWPSFPKVYVHSNGNKEDYLPFEDLSDPTTNIVAGVERSANPLTVDYGTLNKIVYPTKGYTTYTYEVNQFNNGRYIGGGIHIKEIDDYSSSNSLLLSKKYAYAGGVLAGPYPQVGFPIGSGTTLIRFMQNRAILGTSQGSNVGYTQVTETQSGPSGTNGSIVNLYSVPLDIEGTFTETMPSCGFFGSDLSITRASTYFPFFEMESKEEQRGLPVETKYFDVNQNLRKDIHFNYSLSTSLITSVSSYLLSFDPRTSGLTDNLYGTRNLNAEKMLLTSKTEDDYDYNGVITLPSISNKTEYSYCGGTGNHHFLRTETHYDSGNTTPPDAHGEGGGTFNNSVGQIRYKYPFDYTSTASGGAMGQMVDMNYISPVISQVKTTTQNQYTSTITYNNTITYYTNATIHNYSHSPAFGGGVSPNSIVPTQVYQLNPSVPIVQDSNPVNNTGVEVTDPSNPGSLYEKRLEYLNYDFSGNPSIIKKDSQYQLLNWDVFGNFVLSKSQSTLPFASTFSYPPESWNEVNDINAKTGGADYVWSGDFTPFPFELDGVHPTIVSFWAKGGTFSIAVEDDGSEPDVDVNQTAPANWTYYSFIIPTIGRGFEFAPVYLSGTATLDEVSISNDTGFKTTYGYDPLNRLQYIIDPNGKMQSYEYDPFSRLITTRDQNGNILKHTDYHYNGQ